MEIKFLDIHMNLPADEIRDMLLKNGTPEQSAERLATQVKMEWRAKADRVFVISPISNGVGLMAIPEYCREVEREAGFVALSPHMNLGGLVIDDRRPDEMAAFNAFAGQLMHMSEAVIICGNEISPPLFPCILAALRKKKPIHLFDDRLYPLIRHIAVENGVQDYKVITVHSSVLAMPPAMLLQRMDKKNGG